jgi:hypothetical protein
LPVAIIEAHGSLIVMAFIIIGSIPSVVCFFWRMPRSFYKNDTPIESRCQEKIKDFLKK